jgi:hypothetical protein
MPLNFDERGLLPIGVHDATIEEVGQNLARFQKTDRRMNLFEKLKSYLKELAKTDWEYQVIIDGSFVMTMIDEPNDIDVILVFPVNWDLDQQLRPFEYNLVSKKATKRNFSVEVYPVVEGSVYHAKFMNLFQDIRREWCELFGWPLTDQKGVVRIVT